MSPWDWLGIAQDASEAEVKRAYAKTLRRHRPDEDPQGFQTTHEAYRIALQWARRRPDEDEDEDEDEDDTRDTPTPEVAHREDAPSPFDTCRSAASNDEATSAATDLAEESVPTPESRPETRAAPEPPPLPEAVDPGDLVDPDIVDPFYADTGLDTRTQPCLPLDFDAPILRRVLETPTARVDLAELRQQLGAALTALDSEQRLVISQRIAAGVESWSEPPAPGVVSVLADLLDWDTVFLRYRPNRIAELLAADEAHAALQARLQDAGKLSRPLRALASPVRLLDPHCWPLWLSPGKVWQELARIHAESPIAVSQLDPGAVALTRALMDEGHIGLARLLRWLALAGATGLAMLLMLVINGAALSTPDPWTFAGTVSAAMLSATYLRARVRQVYALPLEAARQLWLLALLLGLLLLAAAEPDTFAHPVGLLSALAVGTTIGAPRFLPGMLLVGASLMLMAVLEPVVGALPDAWFSALMVGITALVHGLDYAVARHHGLPLYQAREEQQPLYLLGAACFLALLLAGAVTEESRKPIPVRPTHSA